MIVKKTISEKTKMKSLPVIDFFLKHSDDDLLELVKDFDVPEKIGLLDVKKENKLTIGQIFNIWDLKPESDIASFTVDLFLADTKKKKALYIIQYRNSNNLPMIDFLRLCSHTTEVGEKVAKLFDSLHREPKDENKKAIFAKYKGNRFDFIKRFCDIAPAYTYDEAYNVPWPVVYMAFKSKVQQDDIDAEIAELELKNIKKNKK